MKRAERFVDTLDAIADISGVFSREVRMVALKKPKPRAPLAAKPREDVTLDTALEIVNEHFAKTLAYLGK